MSDGAEAGPNLTGQAWEDHLSQVRFSSPGRWTTSTLSTEHSMMASSLSRRERGASTRSAAGEGAANEQEWKCSVSSASHARRTASMST